MDHTMEQIIKGIKVRQSADGNPHRRLFYPNRDIRGSKPARIFESAAAADKIAPLAFGLLRRHVLHQGKPHSLVRRVEYGRDYIGVTLHPSLDWNDVHLAMVAQFIAANLASQRFPLFYDEAPEPPVAATVQHPTSDIEGLLGEANLSAIEKFWQDYWNRHGLAKSATHATKAIRHEYLNAKQEVVQNRNHAYAVRSSLPDGTRLVATASRLTLESTVNQDAIRHMILYAKHHWDGRCVISKTTSKDHAQLLREEAQRQGVTIVDLPDQAAQAVATQQPGKATPPTAATGSSSSTASKGKTRINIRHGAGRPATASRPVRRGMPPVARGTAAPATGTAAALG